MGISALTTTQKLTVAEKPAGLEASFHGRPQGKTEVPQVQDMGKHPEEPVTDVRINTKEKLERIARAIGDYVESIQRDLHIKVDDQSEKVVIQVISKSSGKVIRQIPPEEMLKIASKIEEMMGVLFDKSA